MTGVLIDWTWLLLAIPLAFVLGWFGSRLDIFHWRVESRHKPKAYFKGLNFILSGQQDKAVDAFIEAVQNDPDTAELHFTLGNLFRRRGEYTRATRVHEHLMARADLTQADRVRAQLALAQDYMAAGLMDRAETALADLHVAEALQLKLQLFERGREWQKAITVANEIEATGAGDQRKRIAHYWCELRDFKTAMQVAPALARPYIASAKEAGAEIFAIIQTLLVANPQAAPLVAHDWLQAAPDKACKDAAIDTLQTIYEQSKDLDVLRALIAVGALDAQSALKNHLNRSPSLSAAAALSTDADIQAALLKLSKKDQRYRCTACNFEAQQYFWQCPGCQAWDSYPMQKLESL